MFCVIISDSCKCDSVNVMLTKWFPKMISKAFIITLATIGMAEAQQENHARHLSETDPNSQEFCEECL
jgi:hypothetical protein